MLVRTPDETLPERLRRLRESAGLTKTALAGTRYTVAYLSQIESGRRNPSAETLSYLAEALGVDAHYLATGVPANMDRRLSVELERIRASLREGGRAGLLEELHTLAEEAGRFGMTSQHGIALFLSGVALVQLGRLREAIDRFEEALEIDIPLRDRGLATAWLSRTYVAVGDLGYGAQLIESFLAQRRSEPLDPSVGAELHSVLLRVYLERGDLVRAERAARRALAAAEESVSPQVRANVLWSAARILAERNEFAEALELSRQARQIIEQQDDRLRLARINNSYAFLCLDADPPRTEEARQHLDAAERLLVEDGTSIDLAYVYTERSRLALALRDARSALSFSERSLALIEDDVLERGRALFARARALVELGREREAVDALEEAATTFGKVGARQQETACWLEIGRIELEEGRLERGLEALRSGLGALESSRERP